MQISVQSAKQNLGIEPAPHLHCQMSTTRIMMTVIVSLIPAVGVMTYFFGSGTLIQFIIAAITAIACQVLTALMRSRPVKHVFRDPSGVVTALLLALTLPPLLPWYFTVMATAFAMLLVRECFGGLGMNIFNPAMSGFIFLVISAPGIFYSTWVSPTPGAMYVATPARTLDVVFNGADPQLLIKEIKDLNRQNEYEVSHLMAQDSQTRAQTQQQEAAPQDSTNPEQYEVATNSAEAQDNAQATDNAVNSAAAIDETTANTQDNAVNAHENAENAQENAQTNASQSDEPTAMDAASTDANANAQDETAGNTQDSDMIAAQGDEQADSNDNEKLQATSAEVQIAQAHDVAQDVSTAKNENAAKVGQSVHMQDEIIANAHDTSNELLIREQERLQEQATIAIEGRFTADALTGATFLESIKTSRKAETVESVPHVDFTGPSFMAYAWLGGAYVLGGIILIFTGCIRFQVPLAFLGAFAATAAIWHHFDPALSITTVEHLLMGGTMLGAFYIITDPVTTCGTFKGRIILSAFIGVLAVIMRINGSYSDSIAFAVMLGNCLAPVMDVMTKRRPFGIGYRTGGLD